MLVPRAIAVETVALGKHNNQAGRNRQMRLVGPRSNRLKRADLSIAAACIKSAFFFFGCRADFGFHFRVLNGHKMPGC